MKRHRILMGGLLISIFCAAGLLLVGAKKEQNPQILSEIRDEQLGSGYVLGRYNGLLDGWDVAFFHKNVQGEWVGFYLAHEARRWRRVALKVEGGVFIVRTGDSKVAEYDPRLGTFNHKLQSHVYSKQDGLEGGIEAGKWGLPGALRPTP